MSLIYRRAKKGVDGKSIERGNPFRAAREMEAGRMKRMQVTGY
jgi:hypothetical protein